MSIKNENFLSLIVSILDILELSLVYTLVNSTKLRPRVVFSTGQKAENLNHSKMRSLNLIFKAEKLNHSKIRSLILIFNFFLPSLLV